MLHKSVRGTITTHQPPRPLVQIMPIRADPPCTLTDMKLSNPFAPLFQKTPIQEEVKAVRKEFFATLRRETQIMKNATRAQKAQAKAQLRLRSAVLKEVRIAAKADLKFLQSNPATTQDMIAEVRDRLMTELSPAYAQGKLRSIARDMEVAAVVAKQEADATAARKAAEKAAAEAAAVAKATEKAAAKLAAEKLAAEAAVEKAAAKQSAKAQAEVESLAKKAKAKKAKEKTASTAAFTFAAPEPETA